MLRRWFVLGAIALPRIAGQAQKVEPDSGVPGEYVCPMDPDVRSLRPGTCPRCGMKLVPGIAELLEYPVALQTNPSAPHAGKLVEISYSVRNPVTGARVKEFERIHDKLYHTFIV